MRKRRRLRAALLVGVGVVLTGAVLALYGASVLRSLELQTVDARFSIRGRQAPPKGLVVVAIDARTFADLNLQWPFPRSLHAQLIDRLRGAGATAIVYDVQFSEQSTPINNTAAARQAAIKQDNALLEAVARADDCLPRCGPRSMPRVALATTEVGPYGENNVFGGGGILDRIGTRAGAANFPPDPGGVNRRLVYSFHSLKSLPIVGAEIVTRRPVRPSDLHGKSAWVDFAGPPGTIPTLSFSRVVRGQFPVSALRGKTVVVGASVSNLQDVHPTSVSSTRLMSGAELVANAIATAKRDFPLQPTSGFADILAILALGLIAPLTSLFVSPLRALALAVVVAGAYVVAAQLLFDGGTIVTVTYPLAAMALSSVGALGVHYLTTAFERERVRDLFARFVPETVVDDVLARSDGERLGGQLLEATILFSDLRGFTTYSESLPAAQVIEVLNRYLSVMSDTILDHGGTLTAYLGDGIMAMFGGPIQQADHADRALAAASDMLERLKDFNRWVREAGLGDGFRMGIGLNSGPVMAGNVGSERRLEYTAIGDAVNTASRLEGLTKGTPHQLFIADSTRQALTREVSDLIEVGELAVRGRQATVKVWSIPAAAFEATTNVAQDMAART